MDNRPLVSSFTSRYNQFLYAPICEEANGMQLSVLSALARMDVDPWEEATRLAAMPKAIAVTLKTAQHATLAQLPRQFSECSTRAVSKQLKLLRVTDPREKK